MIELFSLYPAVSCAVGAILTLALAFCLSFNRAAISYKAIFFTLILEIALIGALLKTVFGKILLGWLIGIMQTMSGAAQVGITFVFGPLGTPVQPWGFVFAFHVLPVVVVFSAIIAVLSYTGIIDTIIGLVSRLLRPILGTKPAETACAVAKSFLGPTEAQLIIRHYLPVIDRSEMFAVMVSSLSMISASLFVIYQEMGIPGNHLLAANFMGIPGALLFAKIIMPAETKTAATQFTPDIPLARKPNNSIEALIQGTLDGLQLVLAIGALLLTFLASISLLNTMLMWLSGLFGMGKITFEMLVGFVGAPFGLLLGVPSAEAFKIGELIGIKFLANEMVAFAEVAGKNLSDRGLILSTYALCGFANIACVGIVVGGISTLTPERRSELSGLAWYALAAATLSNLFSAYLVGIIL